MTTIPTVAYPHPGQADVPLDARIWISVVGEDLQGAQNTPAALRDDAGREIALVPDRHIFLESEYRLLRPNEPLRPNTTYTLVVETPGHTFSTSDANQPQVEPPRRTSLRQHVQAPMAVDDCTPSPNCARAASLVWPGAHAFPVANANAAPTDGLASPGALPRFLPYGPQTECVVPSDTHIFAAHVGVNGTITPFVDLGRVDGAPDAGCVCAAPGSAGSPVVLLALAAWVLRRRAVGPR